MNKIIKETLVLFAITLTAGLLLGAVYQVTKAPIEEQQRKTKERAYSAVFSDRIEAGEIDAASLKFEELSDEQLATIAARFDQMIAENNNPLNTIDGVCYVYSNDVLTGYIITVTNHEGYGGDIKLVVGYNTDQTISGISILSLSETPGLGMNAKNESFIGQFKGASGYFNYTKTGRTNPNEIDAITSATYTTKSVTNGVNAANAALAILSMNSEGGR